MNVERLLLNKLLAAGLDQSRLYCQKTGASIRKIMLSYGHIYIVIEGDQYLITSTQLALHNPRDHPSLFYSLSRRRGSRHLRSLHRRVFFSRLATRLL